MTRTVHRQVGRNLTRGGFALAWALVVAQPAVADRWHQNWHRGYHSHSNGIDAGTAAALGLITGLAFGSMAQPRYLAPPSHVYAPVYGSPPVVYDQSIYTPPAPALAPLQRAFIGQPHNLRVSIQYKLAKYGYYSASLDGLWGPATQRALYSYARDHGQLGLLTTQGSANALFSDILS